jgi:hypothetical protein
MSDSSHTVFISYSSKDVVVAKQVLEYLEKNDIDCWIAPRNIMAGKHYASSILDAIKSSKVFFLLFSPYSNISEQCLKEVDRAVNAKIPIIPFRLEEHSPTEAMEYYLCNTHWLDAFYQETGHYFPQLLSTCQRILAGNTPGLVTPSRTQKQFEEISDGMKEMFKKIDHSIASDEKESINFYNNNQKVEVKQDKLANPLVEATQQNYNIEKFHKGNKANLDQKKLKKKKTLLIKPKEKKSNIPSKSNNSKLLIPFYIILFGFFAIYTWNIMYQRIEKIKEIKAQAEVKGTGSDHVITEGQIDYKYLAQNILSDDQVSFLDTKTIKEYRSLIISKEGNLFERVGGALVEKDHNRFEINNLALFDTAVHRENNRILQSFQNNNLDLNMEYPLVFISSYNKGNDLELKASWKTLNEMLKRLVRDHTVQALSSKSHPDQEDHSREFYTSKKTMFVKIKVTTGKKHNLKFFYQSAKNNTEVKKILEKYSQAFRDDNIIYIPRIINPLNPDTVILDIKYEVGLNIKEGMNQKQYEKIKVLVAQIISEIALQIASPK